MLRLPRSPIIVLGLLGSLSSCTATRPVQIEPERWLTYRDADRHFCIQYPEDWGVATAVRPVRHYRLVFVSLNSAGVEGLRITELQVTPNTWKYAAETTLHQLPPGCAHMDAGWWEFPGLERFGPNVKEMTADDLGSVLPDAGVRLFGGDKLAFKELKFSKWGRAWSIYVYFHEPVSPKDRRRMQQVLESFRFDAIPVGDEIWAIGEARMHLPPEADPDAYRNRGGNIYHRVKARRVGDAVLVTFTKSDPEAGVPPTTWRFRVTARGQVIPIETAAQR